MTTGPTAEERMKTESTIYLCFKGCGDVELDLADGEPARRCSM
jgi:hypothetical protein